MKKIEIVLKQREMQGGKRNFNNMTHMEDDIYNYKQDHVDFRSEKYILYDIDQRIIGSIEN